MRNFEIERKYEYEEDEIDLTELLKTIIREKKIVIVSTIIFALISCCFAFYKENKPREYTVSVILNNKAFNLLIPQNIFILEKKNNGTNNNFSSENNKKGIDLFVQKINLLLETDKIDNFLLTNNTLKLTKDEKVEKTNENLLKSAQSFYINDFVKKEYIFTGNTKDKNFVNIRKDMKEKLQTLNSDLNNYFKNNLQENIFNTKEEFNILQKETETINQEIKNLIKNNQLTLTNNYLDDLSIENPILYIKFMENIERVKICYSNLQTLLYLEKIDTQENILSLEIKNIKFNDKKINPLLIIAIGIFLGISFGVFCAIVKEPLKNIFIELKEE